MRLIIKSSQKQQVIDITGQINGEIGQSGTKSGICHLFLTHTTAALTTADLDPGTDEDMLDAYRAMIPELDWRHAHNPAHTPDHIASSLIGTSLSLPIESGELTLGSWQRVVLVEFDGPRDRQIELKVIEG